MANDLTTHLPRPMAELPQWLVSSVSAMTADYPPKIPASLALSTMQRREVTAMIDRCSASLAPATRYELGSAVMRLLADYPADGANAGLEEARSQNWLEALEGLPAWAVDAARKKWVRGEVEGVNPDFAPKPARFRLIARGELAPVFERQSRLMLLLKAEPQDEPTPEERARVRAKFADWKAQLADTVNKAAL